MKSSISCAALLVALSAGTAQATGPICQHRDKNGPGTGLKRGQLG